VRNAFFVLLLCNLAYGAWAIWIDVPPPLPVNPAAASVPSLKLADEVPLAERPLVASRKSDATACFSVGPFADTDSAGRAMTSLRQKGFEPKQRADESQTQDGYWVFVTVRDQSDIDRALVTLEHGGIRDAIIMPVTPEVNGRRLSLGLYADRSRADKRAQVVGQTGLKAEVGERKLPATQYWLDMAPLPGAASVPIQDLFADSVNARIAVQPCPPLGTAPGTAAAVPASRTIARPVPPVHGAAASATGTPPGPAPQLR
jgi:SPOR domain